MGRIDDPRWDAAGGFEFEPIRRNRINRHGAVRAEVRAPKLVHWYLRGPPGNVVVVQSCLGLVFIPLLVLIFGFRLQLDVWLPECHEPRPSFVQQP